MASSSEFDFELVFIDSFSQDVFDSAPIQDNDGLMLPAVHSALAQVANIMKIAVGIRSMSIYTTAYDKKIKITLKNSSWIAPALPINIPIVETNINETFIESNAEPPV
jgi:hypothetical protein